MLYRMDYIINIKETNKFVVFSSKKELPVPEVLFVFYMNVKWDNRTVHL